MQAATETTRFIQAVHTLTTGDAISGEVLALDRCFRESGRSSEIISLHTAQTLASRSGNANGFALDPNRDELILHYSLGSPLNKIFLDFSGKKTLVYHNLTPPRWFKNINPRLEQELIEGLHELPQLCKESTRIIADSKFNASEIEVLGFPAPEVLELCMDPTRWLITANGGIASLLQSGDVNVLHVGRLAPNKCIEDIIRIFFFYHHQIHRRSKLWLVGTDVDTEIYSYSLRRLCEELGIQDHVHFTGALSDEEVLALYQNSHVYLCMSEHEGFCVPVVEALHYKLPVIAYASSAVPATLGTAGVLVKEKRHSEIAQLIDLIQTDASLRSKLIERGVERMPHFSFERFSSDVRRVFGLS